MHNIQYNKKEILATTVLTTCTWLRDEKVQFKEAKERKKVKQEKVGACVNGEKNPHQLLTGSCCPLVATRPHLRISDFIPQSSRTGGQEDSCGSPTQCGSIFSHDNPHGGDDLLGHRGGHGGGVEGAVGVPAQVVNQLLMEEGHQESAFPG